MENTMKKDKRSRREDIKAALSHLGRYKSRLIISLVLSAVSVVLTLYIPVATGDAIDLVGTAELSALPPVLIRIGVCAAAASLLQWITGLVNNTVSFRVLCDVRRKAFSRIQILPFSYLDKNPTGDIVNRLTADADQFADGVLMGLTQFFTGAATIAGALIFMLSVNVKAALLVVALTPISLFTANFITSHSYTLFKENAKARGEQTAFADEMISNQRIVRAFVNEDEQQRKFDELNEKLRKTSMDSVFYSSLVNPTTRFVNNLVYAAVALLGALFCVGFSGEVFTVGALTALLSYVNQYTKPFNEISGVAAELENSIAGAGRLFRLMEEEPQKADSEDAVVLSDPAGHITFEDVSFSYDPEKELIKDLNLDIKPGSKVAIVGPTGCGKTTLINLLMRFYDVDSGRITVDGSDSRNITRESLRSNIGMVLQDTWLRSGTVRDNILLGREGISEEEMIEAAKAAHSYSFIRRLPQGFDTPMTEDGGSLSAGQKQLLCITRVMLSRPPMLILDEATSSIDTMTEIRIGKAFDKLSRGKTSFIVAHRLSTIISADLILVMKGGRIIEQGDHKTLLEKGGFYSELYNAAYSAG